MRPSVPSRTNTGIKEMVMIASEKKMLGPTCCMASIITSRRDLAFSSGSASSLSHRANRLWILSIMTIAASSMAPMATAMPPKDMMLTVSP